MVGTAVAGSHKTRRCYNLKPPKCSMARKGRCRGSSEN